MATTEHEALEAMPGDPSDNVLERLRARRRELAADHTRDIPVPGYEDLLVVRYGPLSAGTYSRLAMSMAPGRSADAGDIQIEALIEACREVLMRDSEDAPLIGLDPDGGPVRFDARLSQILEIEIKGSKPRPEHQVVLGVFGNGAAISQHALAVFGFSSDVTGEIEEELEGESWGRPS